MVVVDDEEALLARATEMLTGATPSDGYMLLLAPLLLVRKSLFAMLFG